MERINDNLIIAGPCAIENREQMYKTFQSIHNYADIFRAGIWKGRTSPKSYPGCGEQALPWIQDIQKEFKMSVAIEVGTTKHVELALKYDIKIMWVGARTTVNPFAIQEIAESVRNIDVEMWVKNPIISDMKLWEGAIDRFNRVGVKNIKTIYRGFHSDNLQKYRNHPRWDLLTKFRNKNAKIPIVFDPSHLSGNTKHIKDLTRKAKNQGISGFMFEVHNDPKQALSDNKQQLNPEQFKQLIKNNLI